MNDTHGSGLFQYTTDLSIQVFLAYAAADNPSARPATDPLPQAMAAVAALRQLLNEAVIPYWECPHPWPPNLDPEAAISRATEACENYVLVLSPQALADAGCLQGLLFALSLNKRIVPLLVETVPTHQMPEPLQSLHLIDLRSPPPAPSPSAHPLGQVLHHEADYHRAHTQLLIKALRWERRQRDPALLLEAAELPIYQRWLAMAQGRSRHRPIQLQTLYVAESGFQVAAEAQSNQGLGWLNRWRP